jgi:DNA polymerase-3 subunit beta
MKPCDGALSNTFVKTSEETTCELRSGKAKFNLKTLSGRDFTKLPPRIPPASWVGVAAPLLSEMLTTIMPSVSLDETRQTLYGALLEGNGKTIAMTSTDGHRLSRIVRDAAATFPKDFVIPRPALEEIGKCLATLIRAKKSTENIEIHVVEAAPQVKGEQFPLPCKHQFYWRRPGSSAMYSASVPSDPGFPPYDQVIPRRFDNSATVNRQDLLAALTRIEVLSRVTGKGEKKAKFTWSKDQVKISADTGDDGYEEDLSAQTSSDMTTAYWEEDRKQRFQTSNALNVTYALDVVERLRSETIWLGFQDHPLDPIAFKTSPSDVDVFIVMPMKL